MLQYITLVLTDWEKEQNRENTNASAAKGFKFTPVLSVVFYPTFADGITRAKLATCCEKMKTLISEERIGGTANGRQFNP